MKAPRESSLYPIVERWMKRHFLCFKTGVDTGLKHSRVGVVGVRDIGGDLSGDVETIAVEVKKTGSPFATTSGQTLGYNVYANRVYFAESRPQACAGSLVLLPSKSLGLFAALGQLTSYKDSSRNSSFLQAGIGHPSAEVLPPQGPSPRRDGSERDSPPPARLRSFTAGSRQQPRILPESGNLEPSALPPGD